jgi:histone-lysine N-methyltransferase SUV39H
LKLCIFRTSNGCGWGVKTLETIRKNCFVIEYVGEIITNEEAEKRGVQYGK